MTRSAIGAFEATVRAVDDLSPTFRRVTLGGDGLEGFGPGTHPRDLRIKLVIPPGEAPAPQFDLPNFLIEQDEAGTSWYQAWLRTDAEVRGSMRTYTVREWRDEERELVIDMVLHTDDDGHSGPAGRWAQSVEVGHRLHVIGPSRHSETTCAGIEFEPGDARQILLAGDETAVPAIASIFDSLRGTSSRGKAILEVPRPEDIIDFDVPEGFEVEWLPRGKAAFGEPLESAVRDVVRSQLPALVGSAAAGANPGAQAETATYGDAPGGGVTAGNPGEDGAGIALEDINIDEQILWDVPNMLTEAAKDSSSDTDKSERPFYAWIAGEAGPVKRLRRYLVQEVGVDRKQIAFMGYWRQGKAEG